VFDIERLVCKLPPERAFDRTALLLGCDVAPLQPPLLHDAVDGGALVAPGLVLAVHQRHKVGHRLRAHLIEALDHYLQYHTARTPCQQCAVMELHSIKAPVWCSV
jgi:hypothetical protein